ncbi:MAG TPA: hypothetical protein VML95_06420 [Longimicrobiales bacterium]|nr:hypothetical protein [Longimicrobiales bacterium]
MRPELMTGMFWAGMLLASLPVALGIWITVFVVRQMRAERELSDYPPTAPSGTAEETGGQRG